MDLVAVGAAKQQQLVETIHAMIGETDLSTLLV